MKKILTLFLTILFFILPISSYAESIPMPEPEIIIGEDELEEIEIIEEPEVPQIVEYDYEIGLDNLYKYSIIALNDADINQHLRGSIWVGGTLTGSQYIDDGALNGVPASDSYIYNNISQLYFKSRTQYQSAESYFLLSYKAVENTRLFWFNMMNDLVNGNESFIYIEPDENGYVDLRLWNYQAQGNDETQQTISTVYWTDATIIDMGGIAGHLIAPYADIYITYCNYCGSVVGWNIYTNGEAHINYYTFEKPEPIEKITPTPTPTITPTPTPTPTVTPTSTPTPTETPTPTPTLTPTITPTQTPTSTPTPTPTPTVTPRQTVPVVRPTPGPHTVPITGDPGFMIPLTIFILAIIGIIVIALKKKNK